MAQTTSPMGTVDPAFPSLLGAARMPLVPTTRAVASLEAALTAIRRAGGTVTSETRTVPGIGSWAFVTDRDGGEVVLWQDATRLP